MALQQLTSIIPNSVAEALRLTESPYVTHGAPNHNVSLEDFDPVAKVVSDLSSAIRTIDGVINALMSCKAELVRSREGHSRIVSALWRMPVEIMAKIFQLSLPPTVKRSDLGIGALQGRTAVFNVAHVCRRWKDIAMSTPRLWDVVNLSMPLRLNTQAADTVTLYKGDLEMLLRGVSSPLYLVINKEKTTPNDPSLCVQLVDAPLVQRLESCWGLNVSDAVFSFHKTVFAKMYNLRRLKLAAYNKTSFDPSAYLHLSHLSLELYSFSSLWFPTWIRSVRCDHLTVLMLIYHLEPTFSDPMEIDLKGLIQSFPRLVQLYISAPYVEAKQRNVTALHSTLRSIGIVSFDNSGNGVIQAILQHTTLPTLSELILQGDSVHEFDRNFFSFLSDFRIRSQCHLQKVGVVSGWSTEREAHYHMSGLVDA